MPRISAFTIAKKDIEKHFDELDQRFFTMEDLERILSENRNFWRLPKSWYGTTFKEALEEKTDNFKIIELSFPHRIIRRMVWGEPSIHEIALSVRKFAYLSHYTALFTHGLTDQISKTIYITAERTTKNVNGTLTQKAIDNAFRKPQRVSQNRASLNDKQNICLHEGSYANRLGVVTTDEGLRVTNIERTLIDAAVRPLYCGGIYEVLESFVRASDKVSINKLTAFLKKINYTYPYHQAIGFYLERSGVYKNSQIDLLRRFNFEYDFYLTYDMKEMEYSKEWKLYYPKGFADYIELR